MKKISIGSNDGVTVAPTPYGSSRIFWVFTIKGGRVVAKDKIIHGSSRSLILSEDDYPITAGVLAGVDVCIGRAMNEKALAIIMNSGRLPLITTVQTVSECILALLEGEAEKFKVYDVHDEQWKTASKQTIQEALEK